MAPVLTTPGRNYDYDYDAVQPCFFLDGEEEEDFYQLLPGPGENIWKKFELLTPPRSPRRTPSLSAAEQLEAASDLLDEDCASSAAFLQSFIIQDCMWSSSFAAAIKLERAVSQRLASLRQRRDSQVNSGYLQDLHTAATDCIDPSAVFPFSSLSGDAATTEASSEMRPDSPPLSSSDSESEGEEEEEDDEEEEEEEVDVVTVDRRKLSRPDASLLLKRSHVDIHQHNYAARQLSDAAALPAGKRVKSESGCVARRSGSPRSDGEDGEDRRRTHNVLERQRRNELKRSFTALRDEVPAVANNEKTAKVAILKTATEFIAEIREDERRLLKTKEQLRKRSRQLRHRLDQLRTFTPVSH